MFGYLNVLRIFSMVFIPFGLYFVSSYAYFLAYKKERKLAYMSLFYMFMSMSSFLSMAIGFAKFGGIL